MDVALAKRLQQEQAGEAGEPVHDDSRDPFAEVPAGLRGI